MAAYSHFLGVSVKVQYRLGDVVLSASGTFVADSGRSIFLEEHLEQRGKRNYFRWEIPYPYIHRIEAPAQKTDSQSAPTPEQAAAAGNAPASTILRFPQREST